MTVLLPFSLTRMASAVDELSEVAWLVVAERLQQLIDTPDG